MTWQGTWRAAMRAGGVALLLLGSVRDGAAQSRGDDVAGRLAELRQNLRPRSGGVLGLMGYNMTPDGSSNGVQVNRGDAGSVLTLGQMGLGFGVSESVPLYLEGYLGYARYDPRLLFSGGEETRRVPLRWNNVTATLGIGYDIKLTETLALRPAVLGSLGYAASDAALFGEFLEFRTGRDLSPLTDAHMNVAGLGGSLTLAYYDFRPERDIEVELRYTNIRLQTLGDSPQAAQGSSTAETIGLWARYRWPTGREMFGRPIRWVLDGSSSYYFGDQRDALGFAWSAKLGGGIEFDAGRYEIGAMGLSLSRIRLIGRYFFGDRNVNGFSFGIGLTL